jgi:hypothetical protein
MWKIPFGRKRWVLNLKIKCHLVAIRLYDLHFYSKIKILLIMKTKIKSKKFKHCSSRELVSIMILFLLLNDDEEKLERWRIKFEYYNKNSLISKHLSTIKQLNQLYHYYEWCLKGWYWLNLDFFFQINQSESKKKLKI